MVEQLGRACSALHRDESGLAMTEYIIIFSSLIIGMTLAILSVAPFIKAYRDFLVYWLANPLT